MGQPARLHVGPVRLGGLALAEHWSGCFCGRAYTVVIDYRSSYTGIVSITRESVHCTGTVATLVL